MTVKEGHLLDSSRWPKRESTCPQLREEGSLFWPSKSEFWFVQCLLNEE